MRKKVSPQGAARMYHSPKIRTRTVFTCNTKRVTLIYLAGVLRFFPGVSFFVSSGTTKLAGVQISTHKVEQTFKMQIPTWQDLLPPVVEQLSVMRHA
jgi:hypothetical protein